MEHNEAPLEDHSVAPVGLSSQARVGLTAFSSSPATAELHCCPEGRVGG